jgi:hypothetical protein
MENIKKCFIDPVGSELNHCHDKCEDSMDKKNIRPLSSQDNTYMYFRVLLGCDALYICDRIPTFHPGDGGGMDLSNAGNLPQYYTASKLKTSICDSGMDQVSCLVKN